MQHIIKKDNINKKTTLWNIILKVIFAAILIYFMYVQYNNNQDLESTWENFNAVFNPGSVGPLIICLLLMPLNWLIESIKWKLLVDKFEKISFWRSLQAILSGVSIALLTPNRIGEYGGRMIKVDAKNNWKAVIATLISSFSQNIWNIGIGIITAIFLFRRTMDPDYYVFIASLTICGLCLFLLLAAYFNLNIINVILQQFDKWKLVKKSLYHLKLLRDYGSDILVKVLFWALVRYMIYFLQYFLILDFFGIEIGLLDAFIGISTIFLIQTSLPLPPILGFIARGEIALIVWEQLSINEISVLSSSYSLWFINLIIPSLFGLLIILSSNLIKTLGLKNWISKIK